jgi:hypothetical protein
MIDWFAAGGCSVRGACAGRDAGASAAAGPRGVRAGRGWADVRGRGMAGPGSGRVEDCGPVGTGVGCWSGTKAGASGFLRRAAAAGGTRAAMAGSAPGAAAARCGEVESWPCDGMRGSSAMGRASWRPGACAGPPPGLKGGACGLKLGRVAAAGGGTDAPVPGAAPDRMGAAVTGSCGWWVATPCADAASDRIWMPTGPGPSRPAAVDGCGGDWRGGRASVRGCGRGRWEGGWGRRPSLGRPAGWLDRGGQDDEPSGASRGLPGGAGLGGSCDAGAGACAAMGCIIDVPCLIGL